MLQIYVYGQNEQGYLEIANDAKLDVEALSDVFDEDLSTGTFSLPIEIPWTDTNRRLLGFAERLQNANTNITYWKVDVYDDGWPELVNGKMQILEKIGSFSYKRGKFSASISGTKGLFGSLIYNKKMSSLQLGGTITWSGKDSRGFAQDVMNGLYPQYNYIGFVPVAIENFIDKNRKDFTTEFLVNDTVNNIVITGSTANDWVFGRPKAAAPAQAAVSGTIEYQDYRTIPFFQLKFILKQIFKEFGFTLTGDIIDTTDFDDVFLFNNYAIEEYKSYIDYTRQIVPANHMPNNTVGTYMLISDFLKNVLSFFNAYLIFESATNTVRIRYRVKNITEKNILSVTSKTIDDFDCTIDTNTQNTGYKLAFNWDANDQYHSDRVKELSKKENNEVWIGDKVLVATVATFDNLAALAIGRPLTTGDCAYVEATNLYYSVADATTTPIKWDAFAEQLQDYEQRNAKLEDPSRSITLGMAPLSTYVQFNATTALQERQNYVGSRQVGSYLNNKGIRVTNTFGLGIFYIKKQTINGVNFPTSFIHNKDSANNIIEKYTLSLQGDFGLAKAFHKPWQDLLEKAELVKTSLIIDKKLQADLENYTQLEIDGVVYLQQKSEKTIPQLQPMVVYLLPL